MRTYVIRRLLLFIPTLFIVSMLVFRSVRLLPGDFVDLLLSDPMSRNIYGARLSLLVGFAATTVAVLVATAVCGLLGFVGGRLDLLTQRFVDAWMAFPGLLLLMTIMSILGTGALQIIIVLGLTYGIGSSRVIRGSGGPRSCGSTSGRAGGVVAQGPR